MKMLLPGQKYCRQHRTKNALRLCTHLACIFFAILHKFSLTGDSPPASNLYNLTKNLTAQYAHNLCAVLPIIKKRLPVSDSRFLCVKSSTLFVKAIFEEVEKFAVFRECGNVRIIRLDFVGGSEQETIL